LGKFTPTDLQSVSEVLPKLMGLCRRKWGAAIVGLMTPAVLTVTPATAQYYYTRPDDDGSGFILFCIVSVVGFGITYAIYKAVFEQHPPPSPEEYDQQAAAYRAKARALDAEAAYDDSRAKAALKKQELKDVDEFLRDLHSKSSRR
jgi:hypothetical protein